jgi:hypothetical protein
VIDEAVASELNYAAAAQSPAVMRPFDSQPFQWAPMPEPAELIFFRCGANNYQTRSTIDNFVQFDAVPTPNVSIKRPYMMTDNGISPSPSIGGYSTFHRQPSNTSVFRSETPAIQVHVYAQFAGQQYALPPPQPTKQTPPPGQPQAATMTCFVT